MGVASLRGIRLSVVQTRPVAKLVPAEPSEPRSVFGCLADRTLFVGDLDRPAWSEAEWKRFERERSAQARAWDREWRAQGRESGVVTTIW
jgi:antitoxin (DNA-binding transcriptional repressor) of toxin-antitoxin stability system